MNLVHMQTTIQTVFGVVDDDGNAIPQQPVTATVGKFSSEAFAEAYTAIAQARDDAIANAKAAEQMDAAGNGSGNRAQRRAAAKPTRRAASVTPKP
jgi:hypothetical protein